VIDGMLKTEVLCIGSATLDNFLTIDESLKSVKLGDKVLVRSMEKHSGGGATNSAAALAKLGLKVRMLTKLGNDHDAEFILKEMKMYRVKNICLHHSKKNTDFSTIISSTKERDRIIYVHKGASLDLNVTDYKKSQLRTKWIYLATLMGKSFQTGKEIAKYAKKKKVNLLFNPSLYLAEKGKTYLKPILQAANILVLNKEEAEALLKIKDRLGKVNKSKKANSSSKLKSSKAKLSSKLLLGLHQLGPEMVIITNGKKKMVAYHNKTIYSLIPPDIKVTGTAGAGDSFTAGFLAGIIKKYSFANALRLGLVNSLSVIQHLGTKDKLLTEKEAKKLMGKYKIKVSKKVLRDM